MSGSDDAVSSWVGRLAANPATVIAIAVVALAAVGGGVYYTSHQSARSSAANNALYEANEALGAQLKTWEATLPKGADVQFQKVDVDSKFGDAVKKFAAVSEQYSGTRAAFEAEMRIGDLYFNHGDATKAISYYEKATTSAPKAFDQANAFSALGYARENSGNLQGALEAYQKALKTGDALKGDLLMSIARCQEQLKQPDQAKVTYDQIIAQLPNTDASKKAQALKAKL